MFALSITAIVWSAIVALTGGFHFHAGGVRISSRDFRDALAIGFLAAAAGIGLTVRLEGWQAIRARWHGLKSRVLGPSRRAARFAKSWWSSLRRRSAAAVAHARQHERWLPLAPALAIAIAGIVLAFLQWANAPPLWLDEEMILLNLRDRRWTDLGGVLWLGQSAPLAWLVVERAALLAFGTGELGVRFVPFLFGIGTIVVSLWIGRRWMTAPGAAALVLLCAFGPWVSHFFFEAKHYSADAFFALLLPALAAWAIEGGDERTRFRRALTWWIVAAAGQMLANGALLVAPGCALYLVAFAWKRDGQRAALLVAGAGIVWLAAFGVHYQFALRFTHESEYLRTYWANEVPRSSMGIVDRARWIGARFDALAANPGGTEWWVTLWVCAALGLAFGGRLALGLAFATVPLAAFILAGLRLVPLYDRFSLWIVPALYVGVARAIDGAVQATLHGPRRRRWASAMVATPLLLAGGVLCADIYIRGIGRINFPQHKHSLHDRDAVHWLMTRLQPGDAVMTTRLGWPAVWWYGNISIAGADSDGVVPHPNGVALLEVKHAAPGATCGEDRLLDALNGYRRVLVYIGFRDAPPGFDYLLLHTLNRRGTVQAFTRYSGLGLAVVFDLRGPAAADLAPDLVSPTTPENPEPLEGCVKVGPARRW